MTRFTWLLFSVILLACGPSTPGEAVEGYTAPDPFQIPCGAGYTRVQPHFCAGTNTNFIALSKGACSSFTPSASFTGVPSNARAVLLLIDSQVNGGNTLNQLDSNFVAFFTGAGCGTGQTSYHQFTVKEFVAINNTSIGRTTHTLFVQDFADTVWYLYSAVGGNGSTVNVLMAGYYD